MFIITFKRCCLPHHNKNTNTHTDETALEFHIIYNAHNTDKNMS